MSGASHVPICHGMVLRQKQLFINRLEVIYFMLVVLYGRETWSVILREEHSADCLGKYLCLKKVEVGNRNFMIYTGHLVLVG
jgi:hypothetical protein